MLLCEGNTGPQRASNAELNMFCQSRQGVDKQSRCRWNEIPQRYYDVILMGAFPNVIVNEIYWMGFTLVIGNQTDT